MLFTPTRNLKARRGAIAAFAAFMMVIVVGMVAFGIDLGYIVNTRTELQKAADAAAFAGASQLVNGTAAAQTEAMTYLALNPVGGRTMTSSNAVLQYGNWDLTTRTFSQSAVTPNALKVTLTDDSQPLFFGKIFGRATFTTSTSAIAIYQPRDIALVLDYSASMAYDSQFRNISLLGQTEIETNLQQIYTELGSPKFGSLTFNPVSYGTASTSNTTVINHFGLNKVNYPYPAGSWSEYVDFVQTDSYINSAGYRNCYGYMTWVDYVLSKHPGHSDTPALANVSEQPVTALKDAVDDFLAYLTEHCAGDQVSLSIYTYSDGTATLEQGLTPTFSKVSAITRARQAGHYLSGTNISAGMTQGRTDLQKNARVGSLKMMVVMTDGVVNLPSGNTTSDKAACVTEATKCAGARIPIVTISLGALADTALMQQLATVSNGAAFVVQGGQPIADVRTQLEQVFAQVAADRPLKLVQ
ncbi:MAG TPA: pilus assembly protein TadG-related protein [Pirellulales bacterium]|jgi:Flp pilus assembly protein TadG|nr:pilus assembly protein TadG-related protein [Pirellulales bacterium]